jgi:TatD DNase family protein
MLTADADDAVARARDAGVVAMVCVGTALDTSRAAIDAAARYPDVRATVGLHPHDASRLDAEWDELAELARADGVVGVGETGFDLHYAHSPAADQERAFRRHIRLAHELDRALVIHSREAWDDTFRVLVDEGMPPRTVFHCFTGGPAEVERALALGARVSFSGIVSFKNADDVRAAAALMPDDRMLVETDAPFLAPVPHRGRENEPALVVDVGAALAAATGRPLSEVAAMTRANATAVFGHPA